jgi:hypothetical protein
MCEGVNIMQTFDPLRIPAPKRLAVLKKQTGSQWQAPESRYRVTLGIAAQTHPLACPGFNSKTPIVSAFAASHLPVRGFTYVDNVQGANIRHHGWFADANGQGYRGKVQGIVAMLSRGRFLVGYHWTDNDEYVICTDEVFTDKVESAQQADEFARITADGLREDDERFRAMTDAESLCEDKAKDVEDAYAARNTSPRNRQWARDAVRELREAHEELKRATEAYERG